MQTHINFIIAKKQQQEYELLSLMWFYIKLHKNFKKKYEDFSAKKQTN